MSIARDYLDTATARLRHTKALAERAMAQLGDAQMHWRSDAEGNSIVVLVKHMAGNMCSRWTNFLTTDGEKPDRNRDGEFDDDFTSRDQVRETWEQGWACCFAALEAITRQVSHYAYHVGQIVQLARQQVGADAWQSLSVPRPR